MKLKLSVFCRANSPKDLIVVSHDDSDTAMYGEGRVWADEHDDYVRISAPKTVNFAETDRDDVIKQCCKKIDEDIQEVRAKATEAIERLQATKNELLQLEYLPAED